MDEQNELLEEEQNEIVEVDQKDYTIETMGLRKTLRFRLPFVVGAVILFFILRLFDPNIDFNNVNSPIFIYLAVIMVLLSISIYFIDQQIPVETYHKKETFKKYKVLFEIIEIGSIVPYLAITITILNMFFVSLSPITGSSMEPSYSDDEAIVFSHIGSTYERFDVVIVYRDNLTYPYLLKRVIGLPGESVRISDNEIYIDGILLGQDFIDQEEIYTYCTNANINEFGEYRDSQNCTFRVPSDFYFVMGDNRDGQAVEPATGYSLDSRHFGPVAKDDIYGKVILKFKDYNLIN